MLYVISLKLIQQAVMSNKNHTIRKKGSEMWGFRSEPLYSQKAL